MSLKEEYHSYLLSRICAKSGEQEHPSLNVSGKWNATNFTSILTSYWPVRRNLQWQKNWVRPWSAYKQKPEWKNGRCFCERSWWKRCAWLSFKEVSLALTVWTSVLVFESLKVAEDGKIVSSKMGLMWEHMRLDLANNHFRAGWSEAVQTPPGKPICGACRNLAAKSTSRFCLARRWFGWPWTCCPVLKYCKTLQFTHTCCGSASFKYFQIIIDLFLGTRKFNESNSIYYITYLHSRRAATPRPCS